MGEPTARILVGDCGESLRTLPAGCVQTCVTSPPYWGLRDYGVEGQLGLEETPEEFVANLVEVFREVRRVLADDGTLWLNLGDAYVGGRNGGIGTSGLTSGRNHEAAREAWQAQGGRTLRQAPGCKKKDLVGIPWMVAFALRADGWYLRADIIWSKPNPMPESVADRPSKAHEYIFLLTKSERYYYDAEAIREPLAEKTFTTFGTGRRSKGTDALGAVKSDNFARDVPERRPRTNAAGDPVGANKRSVWTVAEDEFEQFLRWKAEHASDKLDVWTVGTQPFGGAHFATFPPRLIEPCILAGSRPGDTVLDPFSGAGTTGLVSLRRQRSYVGLELSHEYAAMSEARLRDDSPLFADVDLAAAGGAS